ncbi:hypothetical protein V6N13_071924 [Hibiscus sabdariffa]|uniref:Uncharacterized protein n=1 Tax=Hibiscus sabdariffa TaxID=183260 RepID=A0ABR2TCL3_9ROSI
MLLLVQESGWEELRRVARKIEGDLDVKLSSYAKLGSRFTQGGFSDEDYIVFCFKKDGAFILMEDGNKSEESMVRMGVDGKSSADAKITSHS